MQFYSSMDFVEKDIRCRLCGSDESRRNADNSFLWIQDKDMYDKPTKEFLCYQCRYLNNTFCFRCGRQEKLVFHYNNNGLWDGRRICYYCVVKARG